ncbi:MAG TPA: glycosyl hydrolase [bacterium]|nr:glycosyl hydrolase [bacterium]
MDRRDFLKSGMAAGTAGVALSGCGGNRPEKDELTDRVIRAMLAMQRASWEQGVTAQALLEWGDPDTVILMAHAAVVRQTEEGRLGVIYGMQGSNDPASNGEPVLAAGGITGDTLYWDASDRMLDYLMNRAPRTREGVLCHFMNSRQVWVDSLYMAPPFLAAAGRYDEAVRQVDGMRSILWDGEKRLFLHQWDDEKQTFPRRVAWGVGNGWAAAGITRVIRHLPPEMETELLRLTGYVRDVVDGCLVHLREDGLFHDIVDDSESFVETNLPQMLAYTLYRGIAMGWLDGAYLGTADRMRRAARDKVDGYGLVRDVCGSPYFDRPGTAAEGQAFFILMEAARRDLLALEP